MTAPTARPAWLERPSLAGRIVKALAVAIILTLVVYPFLAVLSTSLATQGEISRKGGLVIWPDDPTLEAYRTIFSGGVVTKALVVSIGVTVLGTLASMVATIMMAYGLSRKDMIGGRPILLVALFTMLFSAGIIPNFLVVKQLGLLNSYASLVVPVLVSAFNLVVLRNFFVNIPQELIDSARIDGAGDLAILVRLVLPLSKAVLAVIALFYAVEYWNAFFHALLYLSDTSKWPLALILRAYVLQGQPTTGSMNAMSDSLPPQEGIQMAVVIVAVVPILLVYPFLQRYFTKGVLTGAIKG
ncbi:carbohydrate ABC transporter permease [Actinocatenispora rupis]|uniref:ABC transporter permease n=1 Tax=Actinocatenispora rupis TaxID=519421 RepID=A0A8J3J511_9ACTN|nr:carbohydrate ABC transporter permease [Actinocatenispora rupis]GID12265.1 ABC transporter permease [Actinocatenispora rupis]